MFKALTKFFKFSKSSLKVLKIQSMSYHNSGILIWPSWGNHINHWHSKIYWTCLDLSDVNMFLQTCPDLFKHYDTIWYDSTNMSRLVTIQFYMSQTCLNLFQTKRWQNTPKIDLNDLNTILWYIFTTLKHVWTCPKL